MDRGVGGISWRGIFPKATIYHLGAVDSDHCPLLLDNISSNFSAPRPLRFEATLVRDLRSFVVINQAWSSEFKGWDAFKLCEKQELTCDALKKWNTDVFGFSNIKIAWLTEKIRKIQMKETRKWRLKAQYKDELNEWLLKVSLSNHSFCSYSFKVRGGKISPNPFVHPNPST